MPNPYPRHPKGRSKKRRSGPIKRWVKGTALEAARPLLANNDVKVIFAVPGIVIATVFITFPFVVREVLPVLQAQGGNDEEAALTLGASGWQTFWRVTWPLTSGGRWAGAVLVFVPALGEYVVPHFIGQGKVQLLGIAVPARM